MAAKYSATAHALALPEIRSSIFDAICRGERHVYYRTLLSCTLINSVWYHEAIRRLWSHCGDSPGCENLLALSKELQDKFSGYITNLHLSTNHYHHEVEDGPRWSGWTLPDLAKMTFPHLQDLYLEPPFWIRYGSNIPPIDISKFAQPCLRKVELYTMNLSPRVLGVNEKWIARLAEHSQGLVVFRMFGDSGSPPWSISPVVFASFLESMHSLTNLQWESIESLSSKAFMAIASMEHLRRLYMPIPDFCMHGQLKLIHPGRHFNSLTTLKCDISADGLSELIPHVRNLTRISIRVSNDVTRVIKTLTRYMPKGLVKLRIQPPYRDLIQGSDLLSLARSSPRLQILDMSEWYEHKGFPLVEDLDDNLLKELAVALPDLRELHLLSCEMTGMTEESLISLGERCPELHYCRLKAAIDYEKFVSRAVPGTWKQLRSMWIFGSRQEDENASVSFSTEEKKILLELSKKIRDVIPTLVWPTIRDNVKLQHVLRGVIDYGPEQFASMLARHH